MARINITCDTCGKVHDVNRTNEIPRWVIGLACNWCLCCEDQAEDYYEERYIPDEEGGGRSEIPTPIPDNQLVMPFIFDEIGVQKANSIEA